MSQTNHTINRAASVGNYAPVLLAAALVVVAARMMFAPTQVDTDNALSSSDLRDRVQQVSTQTPTTPRPN